MNMIVDYRPEEFDEIWGHDSVIASLESLVERDSQKAFLFMGEAGLGKTTLCRVTAKALGVPDGNMVEVDAASKSTVEAARDLMQQITSPNLFSSGGPVAVVVDECARLSAQAWDVFLKPLEEGPEHIYWFFATTLPHKVPKTIKTRCAAFTLQPLSSTTIEELLHSIAEDLEIDPPIPEDIVRAIVKASNGSPRQAIQNLNVALDAEDYQEAAQLLASPTEIPQAIELCRLVFTKGTSNASWKKFLGMLKELNETAGPEGVRETLLAYSETIIHNSKSFDRKEKLALAVISALTENWDYSQSRRLLLTRLIDLIY